MLMFAAMVLAAMFAPCEVAPTVDGEIGAGEYAQGVALARPGGTVFFAANGETLFMAWRAKARNNDPGGGMVSKALKRDDKLVCIDDCIELILENPETLDAFHIAMNSAANVFDRRRLAQSAWDNDWDCPGIKVESIARSGVWELEMSVPLKSFGIKGAKARVNLLRESPTDRPWRFCPGDAFDGEKIELDWTEKVPCFHTLTLGDPASGNWRVESFCTWAPAGRKTMAKMQLQELDKHGQVVTNGFKRQKLMQRGFKFEGRHSTLSRNLHRLAITVTEYPGKRVLYSDTCTGRRGAKIGNVPPYAEFDLGTRASGACLYYPGQNRARFCLLPNGAVKSASVSVAGVRAKLHPQADGIWTVLVDLPELTAPVPVTMSVDDEEFPEVCTMEKKHFGWEHTRLGLDRVIVPPFTPIVAEGSAAKVMLRKYAFNGAGLLASVQAKGHELLAAPVRLEVTAGGKTEMLRPAGDASVRVAADGLDAAFDGRANSSSLTLECSGRLEYDGFIWNEFRVGAAAEIERLTIVVPLKDAESPLMHIVAADTIRHNPSGWVPKGEGTVFDSSSLYRKAECPDDLYAYSAVPYAWVGGPERGLSWFVNNTKGMSLDPKLGALRLVRRAGELRLECDLVNRKTRLKAGHLLAFGFEATPVKTADPALRRQLQDVSNRLPAGAEWRAGVNWQLTAFSNHWARVPWQGDWSKFDAANAKDKFTFKYSDPALAWKDEADTLQYQSEWVSRRTGYEGAQRIFLVPSAIEFVLYRFHEWMEHGLDGLYFDDTYIIPCRNPDTSGGSFGILETRELVKRTAVMQHQFGVKPRLLQVHMTNCLMVPAFSFATSLLGWEDHYGEEPFPVRFPIDYVLAESTGRQLGCEGIQLDGIRRKQTPAAEWPKKLAALTRSQLAITLPAGMSIWCRSAKSIDRKEFHAGYAEILKLRPWEPETEFVPFWEKPIPTPEGVIAGVYRRDGCELAVFGNLTDKAQTVIYRGESVNVPAYDYAIRRRDATPTAEAEDNSVTFEVASDGWVWIALDCDAFGATARLDDSPTAVIVGHEGEPLETMRYLARGRHRLSVSRVPKSAKLTVRQVPRIVFTDTKSLARGYVDLAAEIYGWEFFRRWLLPVVNEYRPVAREFRAMEYGKYADEQLRLRGRRMVEGEVRGLELDQFVSADAAIAELARLAKADRMPQCVVWGKLSGPADDLRRLAQALRHYCLEGRTDALPPHVDSAYEKRCLAALTQTDTPNTRRFQALGHGKPCENEREGLKEITLTHPDFVCHIPDQTFFRGSKRCDRNRRGDSFNDHFQVLDDARRGLLYAFWTQASKEADKDQHIAFSKSADAGKTWSAPILIAGSETLNDSRPVASWQQPMLSRSGRLYCLWNQDVGEGTMRGEINGRYSDDGGATWSEPKFVKFPQRASYDGTAKRPSWCNWQRPLRLGKDGKFIVASSRHGRLPGVGHTQTAIEIWRFENIDDDPEVEDIAISTFMRDDRAIAASQVADEGERLFAPKKGSPTIEEGSMVKLPDGRLFMLCRSSVGYPVWTVSADGGETWTRPRILRDRAGGRPILHPTSPCPIYDVKGPEAGSGEYAAFVHNTFDFTAERSHQTRGPIYCLRGKFDARAEQPIAFDFENRELWATGNAGQSWYASCCRVGDRTVMWYNDRKYFLLGRYLDGRESPDIARAGGNTPSAEPLIQSDFAFDGVSWFLGWYRPETEGAATVDRRAEKGPDGHPFIAFAGSAASCRLYSVQLNLVAGEPYRFSAYVRTRGFNQASAGELAITDRGHKPVASVLFPASTGGKWVKVEKVAKLAKSPEGIYQLLIAVRKLSPETVFELCNPQLEPLSEKARQKSRPVGTVAAMVPRVMPVEPLLSEVDATTGRMRFAANVPTNGCRIVATIDDGRPLGPMSEGKHRLTVQLVETATGRVRAENSYNMIAQCPRPKVSVGRRLNNFVTELVNAPLKDGEYRFENPRRGWIFIAFDSSSEKTKGYLNGFGDPVVTFREGEPLETLRLLEPGKYTLAVKGAAGGRLRIHRVKPLMSCGCGILSRTRGFRCTWEDNFGWEFHRRNVLPVTTDYDIRFADVPGYEAGSPACRKFLEELESRGKRVIAETGVSARDYEKRSDLGKLRKCFAENPYYRDGLAICVDEHSFVGSMRSLNLVGEAAWEMADTLDSRPLYMSWFSMFSQVLKDPTAILSPVVASVNSGLGTGGLVSETYVAATADAASVDRSIDTFRANQRTLSAMMPESGRKVLHLLNGWNNIGCWTKHRAPQADEKVLMDRVLRTLATDPEFAEVGGLGFSTPACSEELFRWAMAERRHYALDGATDSLAARHGFTYFPGTVTNGDFLAGLDGWQAVAAEPGSISAARRTGFARDVQQRNSAGPDEGDTFVLLRRSARGPNRLSQKIRNLVPGCFYALEFATSDYADVLKPGSVIAPDLALRAEVTGAVFDDFLEMHPIYGNPRPKPGRPAPKPTRTRLMDSRLVFKATANEAELVFSDWADAQTPGGAIGRELTLNYISVTPYFVPTAADRSALEGK